MLAAQSVSIPPGVPGAPAVAMARVSLFGATGSTGLEILTRLLSRPEVSEVRCLVRSPEKLPEDGDPLGIKRGNYLGTSWELAGKHGGFICKASC